MSRTQTCENCGLTRWDNEPDECPNCWDCARCGEVFTPEGVEDEEKYSRALVCPTSQMITGSVVY